MKNKRVSILLIMSILFLFEFGCVNTKIDGRYIAKRSLLGGAYFYFNNADKEFKYYSSGEWGIQTYSKGTYTINKNTIYLHGFSAENIKHINSKYSIVDDFLEHSKVKICINYNMLHGNNMIQTILLIDDKRSINLNKDTTLFLQAIPKYLQVISYMSYNGVLSNPPSIDTLKTSRIVVNNQENFNTINLSFIISGDDFSRVTMNHILKIRKQNILLEKVSNNKVKFQKEK